MLNDDSKFQKKQQQISAFSLTDLQTKIFDVDKNRYFERSRSKSIKFIRDKRLAQPRIIGSPIEPFEIGDLSLKPIISNIISKNECKLNNYFLNIIIEHVCLTFYTVHMQTSYC